MQTTTDLLLELDNLEKDINLLIDLEGTRSEECVSLTTLLTSRIRTRLINIFSRLGTLYKDSDKYNTKLQETSIAGQDLISTLYANLFLRSFLKLVLVRNNTTEVVAPILEIFENEQTGINTALKNILNVLEHDK